MIEATLLGQWLSSETLRNGKLPARTAPNRDFTGASSRVKASLAALGASRP